ncbi:MAG: cell envelope integrity EipB family protein [Rhodospirillaceae bacterium]|nr:cell envelope integrity EipB family protein [Rhodospirillaceae bacterium]
MKKFLALTSGVIALLTLLPSGVTAGTIASHLAVYDVRMAKHQPDNALLAGVDGRFVLTLQKVCSGWIMQQESAMEMQTNEGNTIPDFMNFSAWEAIDGSSYRFSVSRNNDAAMTILGDASISNGNSVARFQKPEEVEFKLPKGVLLPTAHTRELIARAERGESQYNAITFEGTEVGGAKLISTFISKLKAKNGSADKTEMVDDDNLTKRPGWTVHIAYFDPETPSPEPLYEIESDVLDNGVATRIQINLGGFNSEMILRQIKSIPENGC